MLELRGDVDRFWGGGGGGGGGGGFTRLQISFCAHAAFGFHYALVVMTPVVNVVIHVGQRSSDLISIVI